MNLNGKTFRSIKNSETGEVSSDTVFLYHQKDSLVWAEYHGGSVKFGTLIAKMNEDHSLEMRYQHLNKDDQLMTGVCRTEISTLEDGRLLLGEEWQWTSGDLSKGRSQVIEISEG